jgi:DNA-directed RNA polymerase specialized sigma24 family protein
VTAYYPGQLRYPRRRLSFLEDAEDALQDATLEFIQHADALATIRKSDACTGVSLRQTMIDRYRPAATQRCLTEALVAQSHESSELGDHETLAAAERVKATCRVSNPNTAHCCSRS